MRGLAWATLVILLAGCTSARDPAEATAPDPASLPPPREGRGAIRGLVIDDVYRPIRDAVVFLAPLGYTATTDQDGQFHFLDLPEASYMLTVSSERHEGTPKAVDVVKGRYEEVHLMARRIFSEDGIVATSQYSVFVACAASAGYVTMIGNCVLDMSGDSYRDHFAITDEPFGTAARALVLEMKASQEDGYAVALGCDSGRAGAWVEGYGDYIRVVMARNWTEEDSEDGAGVPVADWPDSCHDLTARLWYLGQDPAGTRGAGATPWGVGAKGAMKATFLLTMFVGEPQTDIRTYHVLGPS